MFSGTIHRLFGSVTKSFVNVWCTDFLIIIVASYCDSLFSVRVCKAKVL